MSSYDSLTQLIVLHTRYVVGSIFNAALNKVLKRVINESRPASARKTDPGMPSSHAASLFYLSFYPTVAYFFHVIQQHGSSSVSTLAFAFSQDYPGFYMSLAVASLLPLGTFLTWLRVKLGFHTMEQVLVGAIVGCSSSLSWMNAGRLAVPFLANTSEGRLLFIIATAIIVLAFTLTIVKNWFSESGVVSSLLRIGSTREASKDI